MRKQLLRFSLALLAVGIVALPARASAEPCTGQNCGCPGTITDGSTVCHLTFGFSCVNCHYNCGSYSAQWCVCDLIQGCNGCDS